MVDQDLLTVFLALTAVAVLIQTGILVGFYFISTKLSRQAERALTVSRDVLGPLQSTIENLRAVTNQVAEISTRWTRRAA
jgi:hypothetical protein